MKPASLHYLFLLIIILSYTTTRAQGLVIFKDGHTEAFDNKNWNRRLSKSGDVYGVYFAKPAVMRYQVPNCDSLYQPYVLIPREIVGKINVFADRMRSQTVSYDRLYAEKDGQFRQIFSNELFRNHKRMLAALKTLIADEPEISAMIDSTFRNRESEIARVVLAYNRKKYSVTPADLEEKGSIGFYTTEPVKKVVKLIVNDTLEYKIPRQYALLVKLPTKVPLKVCFALEDGTSQCAMMSAVPYGPVYYEVKHRSGDFEIISRTVIETQTQFAYLRRNGLP